MFYRTSCKKLFSIIAFILLIGCPCIAYEESPDVHEFLHHSEKKQSIFTAARQYLKVALGRLLKTIISDRMLVLQSIFKFFISSLPATHYNNQLVSISASILLL